MIGQGQQEEGVGHGVPPRLRAHEAQLPFGRFPPDRPFGQRGQPHQVKGHYRITAGQGPVPGLLGPQDQLFVLPAGQIEASLRVGKIRQRPAAQQLCLA